MHSALDPAEAMLVGGLRAACRGNSAAGSKWLPALTICVCLFATGCMSEDSHAVWKEAVPSPDGAWIASATTLQNGGFGSGGISTTVYLSRAGNNAPTEVLGFSCNGPIPRPYVLDNAANKGGSINLTMKWITPAHLEVTFSGHPDLYFQAVKFAGIEISIRDLSGGSNTS
jgi:hypothetical protein